MKRPSTAVLGVLLATALIFGGAVAAQTNGEDNREVPPAERSESADDIVYASIADLQATRAFDPTVQIHTIPAAAFTDDGSNPDSRFFPFGGGYFQGDAANYGCMVAPVHLPNGSQVNELDAFLYDNDATFNLTVTLRRADIVAGGTDTMAAITSAGSSTTTTQIIGDATVAENVIDNELYGYYLTTCALSPSLRIYAVQLSFQEDLVVDPHSPVIVPVTPFRAYDSRFVHGSLGKGDNRLVSVRRSIEIATGDVINNNAIPAGATAIMLNLAVTNTIGGGFLAVTPGDAAEYSTASINWSASGQTFNNGTFVQLDNSRRIRAFVGGTADAETDFIIDITGYVLPGG